jgi:hypothetical protein
MFGPSCPGVFKPLNRFSSSTFAFSLPVDYPVAALLQSLATPVTDDL